MFAKRWLIVLWVVGLSVAFLLLGLNLYLGDLNQDEGWYLYASRLICDGKIPYKDFAYTQGPVMPFVYAVAQPFVQVCGLAGGRAFTAMLGLFAALGAAWLAARLVKETHAQGAGILCFILVMVNVYQTCYFAVVKTYSLCSLFLTGGFLLLSLGIHGRKGLLSFFAGLMIALAAGTRISSGVVLPVVFLVLFLRVKDVRAWFWFGVGGVVGAIVVFVPFMVTAPEAFWFFVVRYHTMRHVGGLFQTLVYKAGFVSRLVQAYFVAFGLLAALLAYFVLKPRLKLDNERQAPPGDFDAIKKRQLVGLWLSIIALTAIHFCAPFPYDDYQVPVFTLFAAALSATIVRTLSGKHPRILQGVVVTTLILCIAASFSSPMNQGWFISERDLIWWRIKERSPLADLRAVAVQIENMTRPSDLLLTQDPYIAVEADRDLPHGLEMGQFSYFPELSTEQATRLNVLNRSMFLDLLATCNAPVAALSGYAFAISSPEVEPVGLEDELILWEALEKRYTLVQEYPRFGQAYTTLRIYTLMQ